MVPGNHVLSPEELALLLQPLLWIVAISDISMYLTRKIYGHSWSHSLDPTWVFLGCF